MPNQRARELRWNMTDAERVLWSLLRRKQLSNFRFRRQAPIGPYIADFFCSKARVIIEVDGSTHCTEDELRRDQARTRYLEAHGCRVMRIWNRDVFMFPDDVVEWIYRFIVDQPPSVAPSLRSARHLPPQGGKGKSVAS